MKLSFINKFWIKLWHWEYWPWYIVYIPVFAYWLWCGLKARAIFYISAVNPGFEYGGIIGGSKKTILDKLPQNLVPKSILISASDSTASIVNNMKMAGLSFPVIIKPDVGERGFNVELMHNIDDLNEYLSTLSDMLILQEYIDLPMEAGVFYYRLPKAKTGIVSSVVLKGLLTVIGDGSSTIEELMAKTDRAKLQIARLKKAGYVGLQSIPEKNEELLLEPIGNHIRGTTFLDGTHLINDELNAVFDTISKQINGFYYGRYDLRCRDERALYAGDFKIMELNGAASEPAHIYAPGFPLLRAYRILLQHWRILYKISKINHQNGIPYMSFSTGLGALRKSRFTK